VALWHGLYLSQLSAGWKQAGNCIGAGRLAMIDEATLAMWQRIPMYEQDGAYRAVVNALVREHKELVEANRNNRLYAQLPARMHDRGEKI
jgi:hypothetical protein